MSESGKGITGRVRRAVAGAASAARSVTGSTRRAASSGAAAKTSETTKKATPAVQAAAGQKKTAPVKKTATSKKTASAKKTAPARKAAPAGKAATSKKAASAKKTAPARKAAPAKKTAPANKTAPATTTATQKAAPEALVVRADERPWTAAELAEVRHLLEAEAVRLREEISDAETDIADMLRDSADAGGEDQADTGSKTFEREHEMSLAASHRDILGQTERALARIDDGTYGVCESCGNPIGKARLQAFPRATLCMTCKQREERR